MAELLLPTVGLKNEGYPRRLSTDQRAKAFMPNAGIAFSVKPSESMKDGIAIADTIEKYQLAIKAEKERALVNEAISLYQEDLKSIETDYFNKKVDNAIKGFEDYQKSIKNLEAKYGKTFNNTRMQQALNTRMSDYAVEARVNGRNWHDKQVQAKSLLELEGRLDKSVEHLWVNMGGPFDNRNHEEMNANMVALIAEKYGITDPTSDAFRKISKEYYDKAFYGPIRAMISRDPNRALVYLDRVKGDISDMGYAQFVELAKDRIETNAIRAEQKREIKERRDFLEQQRRDAETEKALKALTQPLNSVEIQNIFQKHLNESIIEWETKNNRKYNEKNLIEKFYVNSQAYSKTSLEVEATNLQRKQSSTAQGTVDGLVMSRYAYLEKIGQGWKFKNEPESCFDENEWALVKDVYGKGDNVSTREAISKLIIDRQSTQSISKEKELSEMSNSELVEACKDLKGVLNNVSSAFANKLVNEMLPKAQKEISEGKIDNSHKEMKDLIFKEIFDIKPKDRNEHLFESNLADDMYRDMLDKMRASARDSNGRLDLSKMDKGHQLAFWYSYQQDATVKMKIQAMKDYDDLIDDFWSKYKEALQVNRDEKTAKADLGRVASDYYYKHNLTLPSENELYNEVTRLDQERNARRREFYKAHGVGYQSDIQFLRDNLLFFGDPLWNDPSVANSLNWTYDPYAQSRNFTPENTLSTDERWRED